MAQAVRHLQKFWRLSPSDRRLLVTAVFLLTAIRLGLWLLPVQTLRRVLARGIQTPTRLDNSNQSFLKRTGWAVTVASRYVPRATCLTQALAVQVLLERRGYRAHLCIGVARGAPRRLEGHAWVEHQGQIVIGGGFLPDILLPAFEEDGPHGG